MIQALRKVKDMATASSGDDGVSRFAYFFRETINWVVMAVIAGLFGTFLIANSAAKSVEDHEKRLQSLENTPVRISVLETKVDNLSAQLDEMKRDNKEMLSIMRDQAGSRRNVR